MIAFGAIDYSVALTFALSRHCDVDFYVSAYHLDQRDPSILDALAKKTNVFRYGKYRHRDLRNHTVYSELFSQIAARNYDVVHAQEYGPPWSILPWTAFLKDTPCILTVHDPHQHPGLRFSRKIYQDMMQKVFVDRADEIIVHSELLKKHMIERYRKAPQNIHVLPHGDFAIMKRWDTGYGHSDTRLKRILFFGAVRPNKGLDYLLKAEPIIREALDDYEIVVAGRCDEWATYECLLTKGARVTVVNEFISNEDVPKYFNEASVVVLPYLSATQSGIIPLAYTFGTPVVATRVGAIPEVVMDGVTGLLVEPGDEKALANAIIRLLRDDKMLGIMGENALKFAEENLSWDVIAKRTLPIYRGLIRERSATD